MIIRRIESKINLRKKRVGAYARVSTEAEEQQESFETQVRYYTQYIQQNPEWEFTCVYADSGRSGTSAEHRPEFMRMIADAREGKMDIILVKSISRFSRNVADAQRFVHELKVHEVEVRFEREAISSFDPSSDMVFSILAAVAQEESRSISENVKWTYRKNAEKGIRHLGNNRVLGYDEIQGVFVPNKDAWIVRQIFAQYASGASIATILEDLNVKGAKRMRSDDPFCVSSIQRILTNEIYVGDRLIQKAAPMNYLTKKPDITEAYTSYYIKEDHEPVIDRDTWERVRARLERIKTERAGGIHKHEASHVLYGTIFCGKCGAPYKRRTVQGKNGLQKVWKCSERLKGAKGNGCTGAIITEDILFHMISDKLGWKWDGIQRFVAADAVVQRVDVNEQEIRVLKKKAE